MSNLGSRVLYGRRERLEKYYKITEEGKEIIDSTLFPFKNIIKRYSVAELEALADYIVDKRETISDSDIGKIKSLEKSWQAYKKPEEKSQKRNKGYYN